MRKSGLGCEAKLFLFRILGAGMQKNGWRNGRGDIGLSKVRVEWPAGEGKWYSVKVPLRYSKKGNMFVRIGEQVYVFKNMQEGQPVLTLKDGKWVQAGRIVYGTVFIGGKDELSYEEYLRSPEGIEASKQLLKSLRRPEASLND